MRIGSSNASTHAAGMSALWHDADYLPEKHIHTPTVEKGLSEAPLPSEQHQLPPGVADPFARLDQVYDVAGQQMERGLEGQAFLHGRNAPGALEAKATGEALAGEELTRTMVRGQDAVAPEAARATQEARATANQIEARAQAGSAPPKVSNATQASDARQRSHQAQKALELAEGLGVSVGAMAVGQALDPSGALGAGAASAASAVKAVSVAKTAVGLASSMQNDDPGIRRGLRGGVGARGHQPSLEPGDARISAAVDPDQAGHQPSLRTGLVGHQPSLEPGEE